MLHASGGPFRNNSKKGNNHCCCSQRNVKQKIKTQTCEGLHTRVNVIANKSLIVGTTSYLAEQQFTLFPFVSNTFQKFIVISLSCLGCRGPCFFFFLLFARMCVCATVCTHLCEVFSSIVQMSLYLHMPIKTVLYYICIFLLDESSSQVASGEIVKRKFLFFGLKFLLHLLEFNTKYTHFPWKILDRVLVSSLGQYVLFPICLASSLELLFVKEIKDIYKKKTKNKSRLVSQNTLLGNKKNTYYKAGAHIADCNVS